MQQADTTGAVPDRRTGYVVKVYPRFSETFIVTEILAREAAGESLEIFALRPTTDTRFHPEIARVQAPVRHIPKPVKLSEAWAVFSRATALIPEFGRRYGQLLPELATYEATDVHQAIELACHVVERRITHLHAHFASLAGRTAEVAAQLAGIEYSVTTHAKDIFHDTVEPERLSLLLSRAHHVVTISEFNLAHLRRAHPESADRIHLVYNGLELGRFPFKEPQPLRPGRTLRVAAVGRMVEKKGFSDLVVAARELLRRGTPIEVRIAGEGDLRGVVQQAIDEAGLHDIVTLLGAQTQDEIRSLLSWADVFAAPSIIGSDGNADGLPTVLLEAMASGVPCVASALTGIPEAIQHGVTGLLHEPGDVTGLADALERISRPGFDRRGIARAARRLIEARFDSRVQAHTLAELATGVPATGVPATGVTAAGDGLRGTRIAYVSVDPGVPVFGTKGASVHVQEVVREFLRRGAQVTVFATRTGENRPADLADVSLVHVPLEARTTAARETAQQQAAADFARHISAGGFDLVYERYSLFSTALTEARTDGIPGILEVNAPLIDEQRIHRELVNEEGAHRALRAQVAAASRTIAVSEPVAGWVRHRVPDAEVLVVPNGVNTSRITPGPVGAPGQPQTVAFVGTLKPWHGVDTLIAAAEAADEDWHVQIIGDGPQGESLRARVRAAGLADRVTFTGAVAPEAIPGLLAGCTLAVAPYPDVAAADSYFSPLKVYEYLAAGLPVVASAVGQIPAILDGTGAGILVTPSDAQALTAAIDALATDAARRTEMSRAARTLAETRHSWARALDQILAGIHLGRPAEYHGAESRMRSPFATAHAATTGGAGS